MSTSLAEVKHRTFLSAVKAVQKKIAKLSKALDPSAKQPPHAITRDVKELEAAGKHLCETLFGPDVDRLRDWLESGFDLLEFTEPGLGFGIPIEFCYFDKGDGGGFFLGDRCVVVRILSLETNIVHADILFDLVEQCSPPITDPIKVGFAETHDLKSACNQHATPKRPDVEEVYALSPIIDLDRIDFLKELKSGSDRSTQFVPWLSTRKDIFHFNSHSKDVEEDEIPTQRGACVRNNMLLLPDDFTLDDPSTFDGGNLVFLNICGSAYGALDIEESIPSKLMSLQVGAVACAVGIVPDALGVKFATEFYRRLAERGTSVLQAMLDAKRAVTAEVHHPLANLYTLIGDTNLSLRLER